MEIHAFQATKKMKREWVGVERNQGFRENHTAGIEAHKRERGEGTAGRERA